LPQEIHEPRTPEELASHLAGSASAGRSILVGGAFSKNRMGGPPAAADVRVTTAGLTRVLQYKPRDLTISVEAGMRWAELTRVLAENQQAVPLDPPFAGAATVGGVLAANTAGPRRRLYGTARDLVIGMTFATLEGKLVRTGGMVVKNVAGLDMGKLLIGSFGTLAAIATVNFKIVPLPPESRHFLLAFHSLDETDAVRRRILAGVLQPAALDLLNPQAAAWFGLEGWVLSIEVGGNAAVIGRYQRELGALGPLVHAPEGLAGQLREATPRFLADHPEGLVMRVTSTLAEVAAVLRHASGPAISRAGSGVTYLYCPNGNPAEIPVGKVILECSPEHQTTELVLWPEPGPDLELMKRVKRMFDPRELLNRGRLFSRI
jgi:glycolate oxidase FAD binding subunit